MCRYAYYLFSPKDPGKIPYSLTGTPDSWIFLQALCRRAVGLGSPNGGSINDLTALDTFRFGKRHFHARSRTRRTRPKDENSSATRTNQGIVRRRIPPRRETNNPVDRRRVSSKGPFPDANRIAQSVECGGGRCVYVVTVSVVS